MKRTLINLAVLGAFAASATGCAGLNVSWSVVATYNTPHATPGEPVAAKKAEPK